MVRLTILVMALLGAGPVVPAELACGTGVAEPVERALGAGESRLDIDAGTDAVLVIEELGVDLQWTLDDGDDPGWQAVGGLPTRLGRKALALDGPTTVRVQAPLVPLPRVGRVLLHCRPDSEMRHWPACLGLDELPGMEAPDGSPWAAACQVQQRYRVALAARAQQPEVAEAALREVARTWQAQGDPAREAVVELMLAEVMGRLARHREALAHARTAHALSRDAGIGYYAIRAQAQTCLALRYLGSFDQAGRCIEPIAAAYAALGEINEAANTWFNIAAFAREDGRPEVARRALAAADELPREVLSDMVKGRLLQIAAGVVADEGDVQGAIERLEASLVHFEQIDASYWQATSYLSAARIHASLGAYPEARLFAAEAERLYGHAKASERVAAALLAQAQIADAEGDRVTAVARADAADALYAPGSRPQLRLAAQLVALRAQPSRQRMQAVDALLTGAPELGPRHRADIALARAVYHLDRGELDFAGQALDPLDDPLPDLDRQIRYEVLWSAMLTGRGDGALARQRLSASIEQLARLASGSSSPALRQIAGRRLLDLRAAWIDTLPTSLPADLAEPTATMLLATQASTLLAPGRGVLSDDDDPELQRALAEALLETGRDEHRLLASQRALWARYREGGYGPGHPGEATAGLRQLRDAVSADAVLLMFGLGRRGAVAIRVDSDGIALHRLAAPTAIHASARSLLAVVSSRAATVADIEERARLLSALLLPEQAGPAPRRLMLMVDESLASVPFATLTWPGQAGPLLDTTVVSMVPTGPGRAAHALTGARPLSAFAAASGTLPVARLPALPAAAQEAAWIGAELERELSMVELDLAALRAALAEPGAWVHVGGHGIARHGLQGYAGLWSDPAAAGGTPGFISWLQLVDPPIAADLVVLNACDLGDTGGAAVDRATSFAAALQAAGARDVVAALWPVSDAAAMRWVPAFYRSLAAQAGRATPDPAAALRDAQLVLRESRAFRHPFYWASLTHLGGIGGHRD